MGRQFVLDVKLRSSQVRARRMRLAAIAIGGVFSAVAALYLAWQASLCVLNVLIYENKAFAIHDIDAQTDGIIAPDQLRRWSGIQLGQNLFALDLAGVKRNLELVSIIRTVSLEKVLPHTIRLRVAERDPVAQLSVARPRAGGGLEMVQFLLDADATVILPLTPAQCAVGSQPPAPDLLPLIVGPSSTEVQPGRRLDSPQMRAALDLILAFQQSSMQALADVKRVDAFTPDVLVIRTGQGSEITFSLKNPDQQLLRWQSIFEEGQRRNKAIASLDLAVSNSVPVTWMDAGSVAQVPVKPAKQIRNRKKHV